MFNNDTNYEQFCHITLKSFKSLIHIRIQKHFDISLHPPTHAHTHILTHISLSVYTLEAFVGCVE